MTGSENEAEKIQFRKEKCNEFISDLQNIFDVKFLQEIKIMQDNHVEDNTINDLILTCV